MNSKLEELDNFINALWARHMSDVFVNGLYAQDKFRDKRLVAIYLSQVYHYAVHTPRHQALVGVNMNNTDPKYMQYCFDHAFEETGHELMALHDIQTLGFDVTAERMPASFASTDLMIAYLYRLAQGKNPIHHLGYGFWSENACPFINDFMQALMSAMSLQRNAMTFYSSHVTIDKEHALHVREIVGKVCKTDDDWNGVKRAAKITFDLTAAIVKDSIEEYDRMVDGTSTAFDVFLHERAVSDKS